MVEERIKRISGGKKLKKYGASVFARIAQMAVQHQAINMAQGFPNFNYSDKLQELANDYTRKGFNQYAPMPGDIKLREEICRKTEALYRAMYRPDTEVTVTTGALQAVYVALSSIVEKDDEVIIFEPAFDCYRPVVELNGGKVVAVKLTEPGFNIDWEEVRKQVTPKTRAIVINSPNNPTGKVFTKDDFGQLISIIKNTNTIVISDEVYEHMVFDGREHLSAASFPEIRERAFVISSFGKTLHVTGWRIGYCLAPDYLMEDFRKIHQFMVFAAAPWSMQKAIADFISDNDDYVKEVNSIYRTKRDFFSKAIRSSRFKQLPVEASFFMLLDYSEISSVSDVQMAEKLIMENKIATIPFSAFFEKGNEAHLLRICFAKTDEVMRQAIEALINI